LRTFKLCSISQYHHLSKLFSQFSNFTEVTMQEKPTIMKGDAFLALLTITIMSLLGFEQKANCQGPSFFVVNQTFVYKAVYVNEKNDTISNELIEIKNTGEPWKVDPRQTRAVYTYHPEFKDELFLPTLHKLPLDRIKETKEGIIDNGQELYIHPIRKNQYYLTEIAPSLNYIKGKYFVSNSKTQIGQGWGAFKGTLKSKYEKKGFEDVQINGSNYENCEKFYALGKHRLGKSSITYYVHAKYGFVKMHYQFFNKHQIIFSLVEVRG
jgi:hypothetical protein